MYSTCLFCNRDLGSNELVESFPVGRRLAFDAAQGRLWVICTRCERWNLSPLEERWEAIEECERLFRNTRLRVSTENVGLARLSEGLTLVRIGEPQRPEMAAWRYGDQFGRRRKKAMIKTGLVTGMTGVIALAGATTGFGMLGGYMLFKGLVRRIVHGSPDGAIAYVPGPDGLPREVVRSRLSYIRLVPLWNAGSWRLAVSSGQEELFYEGESAIRVAGTLLPHLNAEGASRKNVRRAVQVLERAGDPEAVFGLAARSDAGKHREVHQLAFPLRLALEMAAHEETERRALEGELSVLEAAWKQAEEIAAISDSLLVPSAVEEWIARLRGDAHP